MVRLTPSTVPELDDRVCGRTLRFFELAQARRGRLVALDRQQVHHTRGNNANVIDGGLLAVQRVGDAGASCQRSSDEDGNPLSSPTAGRVAGGLSGQVLQWRRIQTDCGFDIAGRAQDQRNRQARGPSKRFVGSSRYGVRS